MFTKAECIAMCFFFFTPVATRLKTLKFKDEVWPDTSVHVVEEWSVERAETDRTKYKLEVKQCSFSPVNLSLI